MNFSKSLAAATSTVALALVMAGSAGATNIVAGGTVSPSVFGGNLGTETLLATTGVVNFSTTVGLTVEAGTYQASVYRSGSFLDFVYTFNENNSSNTAIQSATMANFGSYAADVSYIVDGNVAPVGTTGSNGATRSADGNVIKFFFPLTGVSAGQTADTMIIRVTATNYTLGLYTIQNGVTTNLAGYQPTATPEPATFAMIGAGLLALGFLRRKNA